MNEQAPTVRVPKGPRLFFACLALGNTTLSVAKHYGFLEATTKTRATGCAMGLVILGFGFFLQKLHSRATLEGSSSKAAADRLFGRTLMVAGLADAAVFLSGSLEQARLVSLIIGVGVLLALAAVWSWRLRYTPIGPAEHKASERRMLLASCVYISATAGAAFLFGSQPWTGVLASWMIIVFWMLYIAASAALIEQHDRLAKI
jgi:hypothetical protein